MIGLHVKWHSKLGLCIVTNSNSIMVDIQYDLLVELKEQAITTTYAMISVSHERGEDRLKDS